MDEKNMNQEKTASESTKSEVTNVVENKKQDKKSAPKKLKKLKNKALLKRGGYAVAITAAVLAGIIVLNVLVNALASRVNLEFDLSQNKSNTISKENLEYIEKIDDNINVTVCAAEDQYTSTMSAYASQAQRATGSSDYFDQTVKLVNKYHDYNKKINVEFIDTQSSKFTAIAAQYSNESLTYGDIIVSKGSGENERHKIITFTDIYELSDETGYAAQGMGTYTLSGNNIETALTSAIAYVSNGVTKKVGVITGHSAQDYTTNYVSLLKTNNYDVETISDSMINTIDSSYDAIVICAPTTDFIGTELNEISSFLDNDGKYGKGLIFIADASAPYLTNLYDFLGQYGITVQQGILFSTDSRYHISKEPMTMGIYPTQTDKITSEMKNYAIAGYNVPFQVAFDSQDNITVTSLMATKDDVVVAPVGADANWSGADDMAKQSYPSVIQSKISDNSGENSSYVTAFSSVEFVYSDWVSYSDLANQDITLACAERSVGSEDTGISFTAKTIKNESFSDKVTSLKTTTVRIIFEFLLPLTMIVAAIYTYIRRKNAI